MVNVEQGTQPLSNALVAKTIEENGCFSLIYRRDRHLDRGGKRIYFYFRPHLAITLKADKVDFLKAVRESIGCGKITQTERQARLDVFSPRDSKGIIKILQSHNWQNKNKYNDFKLWEEAIEIILKNQKRTINAEKGKRGFVSTWSQFNQRDLRRLFRIREEMKRYKRWRKADYKWTNSLLARPF